MKGTCSRFVYLLFICANAMCFVDYGRTSACHPHRSSSAADARLAHIRGLYRGPYTHPNKVSNLR